MTLKEQVADFQNLVSKGKNLDAIDKYYADHVVVFENNQLVRNSKTACIQADIEAINRVQWFKQEYLQIVIDEEQGLVMAEMLVTLHSNENGPMKLEEAVIQKWENGKIVQEQFFYKGYQKIEG